MPDEHDTQELALVQVQRERAERARAQAAVDPEEEHAHERRADRAGYLREKLAEREASERAAAEEA